MQVEISQEVLAGGITVLLGFIIALLLLGTRALRHLGGVAKAMEAGANLNETLNNRLEANYTKRQEEFNRNFEREQALSKEVIELRRQSNALSDEFLTFKRVSKDTNEQQTRLLQNARDEIKRLSDSDERKGQQIAALEQAIAKKVQEIDDLQQALAQERQKVVLLNDRVERAETETKTLTGERSLLISQVEALTAKVEELQKRGTGPLETKEAAEASPDVPETNEVKTSEESKS